MPKAKRKPSKKALPESPHFAVIMAGGSGTRFWPLSRKEMPKQCIRLYSDKPLIAETVERWQSLVGKGHLCISTNNELRKKISPLVKGITYIIEPHPRNTAACIGLSCISLLKRSKDAIIAFLPSDHYIADRKKYAEHIKTAFGHAEGGDIVILGMQPTYAATEYGYIQRGELLFGEAPRAFSVKRFVEKPDAQAAKAFFDSKEYYWNSGQLIARADVLLEAIRKHMPTLHAGLMKIQRSGFKQKVIDEVFLTLESISMDYGVLEKVTGILVVESAFPWDDVGSWTALTRLNKPDSHHNVVKGNATLLDTSDSIIVGDKRLIATIGVDNLIVVDTPDAILICRKDRDQDLKELLKLLPPKYK